MLDTDIDAFITVRATSSRLPGKCFLPFGDYSVLEHVIRRAIHYKLSPIVCTTNDSEDDAVQRLCDQIGVRYFRGSTNNKLLRWSDCCKHFGVEAFHSVDADDPFFCGEEVKRSFSLLDQQGLDMIAPCPSSSRGGATVGYSLTADIVAQACEGLDEETDTEMMWSYIEKVPGLKKRVLEDPSNHVITARMTLDYHEDYIFLETIRLLVGNLATRSDIAQLLERNPDLVKINAFRTTEWARNQKEKSI